MNIVALAAFRFNTTEARAHEIVRIAKQEYLPEKSWEEANPAETQEALDRAAIDYFVDMSDEEVEVVQSETVRLH